MNEEKPLSRDAVIQANIEVHAELATSGQYNQSPHFFPENQRKVRTVLEQLTSQINAGANSRLLDFGCGTGFIIHLVKDLVGRVDGIDITKEMMDQVDTSSGNIYLTQSVAEETPFDDETFDIATAYSFMDHLLDYRLLLREACRVLKPGGLFYIDLNPNRDFIRQLQQLAESGVAIDNDLVAKELKGAIDNPEHYEESFGIDGDALKNAEPGKSYSQGFCADEVCNSAKAAGFSYCEAHFDWFFSQGHVMHRQSQADADTVESYLRLLLPHTRHLFKYIRFVLTK